MNENKEIYDYKCYQDYLSEMLPITGEKRGKRSSLAKFLNCRVSHITQVINKKSHFSLEIGQLAAQFLNLNNNESHFFLLLISLERSGNYNLKKYYQKQVNNILKDRKNVKNSIKKSEELNLEEITRYYSSWQYIVIHLLISLEHIKTSEDICRTLKLPALQIKEAIKFLLSANIITDTTDGFKTTGKRLHLSPKSSMISKHHSNLRLKAIETSSIFDEDNLHFSAAYSFAQKDWDTLKNLFLKNIKNVERVVAESKQDTLGIVTLDFFKPF